MTIDGKYHLESDIDAPEIIQLLEDRIYEFNSAKISRTDGHQFSKIFKDDEGKVVAGVGGWTWAGACEITQLWVDEKLRQKGIGKILLNEAEQEAKNRGCSIMLTKTYSFQAPLFYLARGFKAAHIIENFPDGCSYYTLIKSIG
jgi:GNAT superfamily N-acetyltransferase